MQKAEKVSKRSDRGTCMTVLIDSNVMIDFLKGQDAAVEKIKRYVADRIPIFISTVSIYEVYLGIVANSYVKEGRPSKVPELLSIYEKFLLKCEILAFNREAAEKAADLYAQAMGKGVMIKEKDCQIAGIALAYGVTEILTRDRQDFSKIFKITGLRIIYY